MQTFIGYRAPKVGVKESFPVSALLVPYQPFSSRISPSHLRETQARGRTERAGMTLKPGHLPEEQRKNLRAVALAYRRVMRAEEPTLKIRYPLGGLRRG
jgi:hypothetical protein